MSGHKWQHLASLTKSVKLPEIIKPVITTNRLFPSAGPGTQRFEEARNPREKPHQPVTPQYRGAERTAANPALGDGDSDSRRWPPPARPRSGAQELPQPPHRPPRPHDLPGRRTGGARQPLRTSGPPAARPGSPPRGSPPRVAVTHSGTRAPQQRPPDRAARPAHGARRHLVRPQSDSDRQRRACAGTGRGGASGGDKRARGHGAAAAAISARTHRRERGRLRPLVAVRARR